MGEQADAEIGDLHGEPGRERAVAGDADRDRLHAVPPVRGAREGVFTRADEDVRQEDRVPAAVAALTAEDGDLDRLLPVALEEEALALGAQ